MRHASTAEAHHRSCRFLKQRRMCEDVWPRSAVMPGATADNIGQNPPDPPLGFIA
jgi:hypothetical protein